MKTFRIGGIHPRQNKLATDCEIEKAPIPKQAVILLGQHLGAPAEVLVSEGDMVKTGQLIAKASGFVSSAVHSSVSGRVVKVTPTIVTIETIGDEWLHTIDRSLELKKDCDLSATEIKQKIAEAGIVGMGGATFPTPVKLSFPPEKTADFLIINGVECEPYLTCDYRLMIEKTEEILVGTTLLMKATKASKAIIGIENDKKNAIEQLQEAAKNYSGIKIVPLKVKYPQGGEKQLIEALTRRKVPSGGLPIDIGVIVQNVATAFAVYEAVQKNKPLLERVITVTGKSLPSQHNYLARIGTPLTDLIGLAGDLPTDTHKIIAGGPMMGRALPDLCTFMTKGMSGVLLLPTSESGRKEQENCIRCTRCVNVCPMGLEPFLLMSLNEQKMNEELENYRVMDCIECGCCSYVCPSNRPMLDHIREGKREFSKIMRERNGKQ